MSTWYSQPTQFPRRWPQRSPFGVPALLGRRLGGRTAIRLGCLICVLLAEGLAIAHSYIWAAPLIALLIVALAIDLPLVGLLGGLFAVRVFIDGSLTQHDARHSAALSPLGLIAAFFILLAIGLLVRRRQALWPTLAVLLWLAVATAVALSSHGASTVMIREGVREASMVALAVIVLNSGGALTASRVARILQIAAFVPALIALYQLATHTGVSVSGEIRSNGTFSHPNGAAIFFAIATLASLWHYVDHGRRRHDIVLGTIYGAATIATFSIGGVATLLVMLVAFGMLRPGSLQLKLGCYFAAAVVVVAFLATPLGAQRIANESSTRFTAARTHLIPSTSLGWRFYKWSTLIPEWERAPLLGQGLGATITSEGTSENAINGKVPHNEYVRYLVETGAVGFVTLICGAAMLIRGLARRRRLHGMLNLAAFGTAVLVGCLFDAVADNTLLYSTTGYAVALIVAAVLGTQIQPMSPSLDSRRAQT
jgi:O-antigen ligase